MGEESRKLLSKREYTDVETLFKKIKESFRPEELFAFKWAFIIGLLSHLFVYVNHYPTYSGLFCFIIDEPDTFLWQGRFLTPLISSLDGQVTLPWVLGLVTSLLWALVALCIIRIFELRNKAFILMAVAVIVTFPVIAACNTYLYMSDVFASACLMACLGVICWKKESSITSSILSVLCWLGCLALYQPELSLAIAGIVIIGAIRTISREDVIDTIKQLFRAVICLLAALAIWYGIYYLIQVLTNNTANSIGTSLGIAAIIRGAGECYKNGFRFLFTRTYLSTDMGRFVVILTILSIICEAAIYLKGMLRTKLVLRIVLLLALVLVFPMAACYVFLQMPDTDVVSRLFMAYILLFIFPLILADYNSGVEEENTASKNRTVLASYLVMITAVVTAGFFVVTDNSAYMNAHMSYEKEYSFAVRLVDRIETHPDYEEGMQIVIISSDVNRIYNGNVANSMIDKYIVGMEQSGNNYLVDMSAIRAFIKQFIQADLNIRWVQTDEEIKESLTLWPDEDCIKVVDGIMYIKIS